MSKKKIKLITKQERKQREKTINEVFDFLYDHYWDSLQEQQSMIVVHLARCQETLKRIGPPGKLADGEK